MKKILLATSMLVGTAGAASADVNWVGSAYTGLAYSFANGLSADFTANVVALFSTTTDGGLEVGGSLVLLGPLVSVEKDPTDNEFGTRTLLAPRTIAGDPAGGTSLMGITPAASVFVSSSWGKVTIAFDGDADDVTGGNDWDITATYTNTWGNFGLEVFGVYSGATDAGAAATNGDMGIKGTYSFGDYSIYAAVERDVSDGGAITNQIDLKAGATAAIGNFSAAANVKFDIGGAPALSWDVEAGYATGPWSFAAKVDNNFAISASGMYDLGGGVSLQAGVARSTAASAAAADIVIYGGVGMKF